jgi:thioredoxin reductase (NADPH)
VVEIYGEARSNQAFAIRDFMHRSGIPFRWVDVKMDAEARKRVGATAVCDARLPVCVFRDGTRLDCPSVRQIVDKLGWNRNPAHAEYDLAIYGAGPAGLSAAVYGASDGLKTIVVERSTIGGQASSSALIENYLGFPGGISGAELAERAREQACKFGAEILLARAGVRAEFPPGKGIVYLEDGTRVVARACVCATGVDYARLGLPEEQRFFGAGLCYGGGASEAVLIAGEHVYIVGGGNSAGQAAMHFAPRARRVSLLIRGDSLKRTLSKYLIDRIAAARNIEVLPRCEVIALHGDDCLEAITIRNNVTGAERVARTRWLFVCIGGVPQTQWADEVGVLHDEAGYLLTGPDLLTGGQQPLRWPLDRDPLHLETSIPGVFAAGDVRHGSIKRLASAVGEGAMTVALVNRFLSGD